MKNFEEILQTIPVQENRSKIISLFEWIFKSYPQLTGEVKWKQPMFVDHGTFILGFSFSKEHFAVTPEAYTLEKFSEEVSAAGYVQTKNIFKIKWDQEVNRELIKELIDFNIEDKKEFTKFWR